MSALTRSGRVSRLLLRHLHCLAAKAHIGQCVSQVSGLGAKPRGAIFGPWGCPDAWAGSSKTARSGVLGTQYLILRGLIGMVSPDSVTLVSLARFSYHLGHSFGLMFRMNVGNCG